MPLYHMIELLRIHKHAIMIFLYLIRNKNQLEESKMEFILQLLFKLKNKLT